MSKERGIELAMIEQRTHVDRTIVGVDNLEKREVVAPLDGSAMSALLLL